MNHWLNQFSAYFEVAAWTGGVAGILIVCLVVFRYFPSLRIAAFGVAAATLAAMAAFLKGRRSAKKEWQNAIDRDVRKGEKARADAERDVASGRVRGDEWDRDKGGV